jgi:hypothetical protein
MSRIKGIMLKPKNCNNCVLLCKGYHDNPSICEFHKKIIESHSDDICEYKTTVNDVIKMITVNGKE